MASFSDNYAEVVYPDRTRVLGKLLLPLSVGHALLLRRDRSPFAVGGSFGVRELVRSVYILSRPCMEAAAGLQRRSTRRLLRLWEVQVRLVCGTEHRAAARIALDDYLDRAYNAPRLWESEDCGRKLSAPFLLTLKMRLMTIFGCDHQAALDYPLRLALWETAAFLEEERRVEWVSQEQSEAIQRILN